MQIYIWREDSDDTCAEGCLDGVEMVYWGKGVSK